MLVFFLPIKPRVGFCFPPSTSPVHPPWPAAEAALRRQVRARAKQLQRKREPTRRRSGRSGRMMMEELCANFFSVVVGRPLADRRLKERLLSFPLALSFLAPLSNLCCPNYNVVSSRGREEAIAGRSLSFRRKMRALFSRGDDDDEEETRETCGRWRRSPSSFLRSPPSFSLRPLNRTNSNPGAHMTTLHAAAPSRVSCCGWREKEGEE